MIRLAEGLALPGVGDGVVERALGEPGRDGGDAEAAGVETGERDPQAVALVAEPAARRRRARRRSASSRSPSR